MVTERLRGRAGQAQRLWRLKRTNGLCEMCLEEGRTREAHVVDHIVPLAYDGPDTDANTRNLCDPHHRLVTVQQFGFATSTDDRGADRAGRPTSLRHPWNTQAVPPAPAPRPDRRPAPRGVESQRGGRLDTGR